VTKMIKPTSWPMPLSGTEATKSQGTSQYNTDHFTLLPHHISNPQTMDRNSFYITDITNSETADKHRNTTPPIPSNNNQGIHPNTHPSALRQYPYQQSTQADSTTTSKHWRNRLDGFWVNIVSNTVQLYQPGQN